MHWHHHRQQRIPQPTSLIMYIPRSRSALALVLSSLTSSILANPLPQESSPIENVLVQRCAYPCGWGSLCCESAGACYTDSAGQAQCGAGSGGSGGVVQNVVSAGSGEQGQYQLFTTTYTEVDSYLVTSTGSYLLGAGSPTAQVAVQSTAAVVDSGSLQCQTSLGESPCGGICCATGQTCQYQGQCVASGALVADFSSSYLASVTALASGTPALRPTSNAIATVTSTGTPTFTTAFSTPMPTSGGSTSTMSASTTTNSGLSSGAIAGIVIGVLLGIALLLLICGCLCFKGLLDSFLAFFGIGPKRRGRRTETDIYEEEYYQGSRPPPRRWFGALGPARPKKKKSSSGKGILGVAGGLATLAILLGLKRKRDERKEKSSYTGSSYTYSDYTSESEYYFWILERPDERKANMMCPR